MIYHNVQRGFIALMSAVVISVVLLLLATAGSLTGFYSRANILDSEYKEKSAALAEACVDQALLELVNDPSWEGDATSTIGSEQCYVGQVQNNTPISGQKTFKTRSISHNAYTNLEVVVNATTLSLVSFKEWPTF